MTKPTETQKQSIADALALLEDHNNKVMALALALTNQLGSRDDDHTDPVALHLAEILEERIALGPMQAIRNLLETCHV